MKVYLAGPMFTAAERTFLEDLAGRLEGRGHRCFVPHSQPIDRFDPETIFRVDSSGIHDCEAMVAWLDGPMIDDGTACEIGVFSELVRSDPERHRGVVGFITDWRVRRRRDAVDGGINFFVAGAILASGAICWSIEEVEAVLEEWEAPGV